MKALATKKDFEGKQYSQYRIQYSIYIHYDSSLQMENRKGWEKTLTTSSIDEALDKAKILYDSGKYKKIEVKKKVFDPKNQRPIDFTLKIFEDNPRVTANVKPCIIIGVLCGLAAFIIAYAIYSF